jgi:hypothetical protein
VSFAIIRGSNGRRHEVDFGDAEIEVDVAIGSETVQIALEAALDQAPLRQTALRHHRRPARKVRGSSGSRLERPALARDARRPAGHR